jgi:acetolactate synthase-1/2/3 large subunit
MKIFILNNQYMGMVRQWQQLAARQPAVAFLFGGAAGLRQARRSLWRRRHSREKPDELDDAIQEMIDVKRPVIFDCVVANLPTASR